jgi:hypothetical protein
MRRKIRSSVRRLQRRLRRQTGARAGLLGLPAVEGHLRVTVGRTPVVARLDPHLRLAEQKQRVADQVAAQVRAGQLPHFWLTLPAGQGRVLCLRDEDRGRLAELLASSAGPGWYAAQLSSVGAPTGRLARLAAGRGGWGSAADGVRVWEYVVAAPASTFMAAENQGLTIFFWRWDAETGVWRSLVRNTAQSELPGRAFSQGEDDRSTGVVRPASEVRFPVDVVYTWVDGDDDDWLRSKARAAHVADETLFTERAHDATACARSSSSHRG